MSALYNTTPAPNATVAEWEAWIKECETQDRTAKAGRTRATEHIDVPDEYQESATRKVNGRWTQCMVMGFSGSSEDNSLAGEVMVAPTQESDVVQLRMNRERNRRGKKSTAKALRYRRNKRDRKAAK